MVFLEDLPLDFLFGLSAKFFPFEDLPLDFLFGLYDLLLGFPLVEYLCFASGFNSISIFSQRCPSFGDTKHIASPLAPALAVLPILWI